MLALKFRVWLPDLDQMLRVKALVFEEDKTRCVCGYSFDFYLEDENATIMQSTGLKDKNGKEIFEGDILKFNDEWNEYCHEGYVDGSVEGVNYVEVVKGEACFEFGKTRYPESSLFIHMEDEYLSFAELVNDKDFEFEIIGNVYENPDLLEVKE